jgi:micrococcal nuclease
MARRSLPRLANTLAFFTVMAAFVFVLLRPRVPSAPLPEEGETLSGVVEFVYDGDTLDVTGVGKVRVIGIDALDGHNAERMLGQSRAYGLTTSQVEHWAEQAKALATERLRGRRVVLHLGPEREDDYGRTLAYVHVAEESGDQDFGLLMLDRGLGATYRGAQHARQEQYLAAERLAQTARKGMWQDARVRP